MNVEGQDYLYGFFVISTKNNSLVEVSSQLSIRLTF